METNKMNEIASKHLGQEGSYAVYTEHFDPSLLVPMPRILARKDWGITGDEFIGEDIWNCHEATFLLDNGMPVAGTLKIIYPSYSEFMVESKSLKLYLNSFDMCKMGETVASASYNYKCQVKTDLEHIIGEEVQVQFFGNRSVYGQDGYRKYVDLQTIVNLSTLEIDDYHADRTHLEFVPRERERLDSGYEQKFFTTNILRSRCRHTKQKDSGTAFIYLKMKPEWSIKPESLLKEIISLREVNEFHEFCAEKLYCNIMNTEKVDGCCVRLMYARRGGIDINPVRATETSYYEGDIYHDINIMSFKQQIQ